MHAIDSSALMTTAQAAIYLGISKATLDKLRVSGGGPAYVKLGAKRGGSVRYRRSDLDAWVATRIRRSTS